MSFKQKIYSILNGQEKTPLQLKIQVAIIGIILLNIIAVTIESVDTIGVKYKSAFRLFEFISLFVFGAEYVLRVWVSNHGKEDKFISRIKYIFSPLALIDLIAIIPFFIFSLNTNIDLRSLRIFRVMRILKFTRYSKTLNRLQNAFNASRAELIISLVLLFFMLIVSSTLMFFAEHNAQPSVFSDIPSSLWWAVITITTVGYGDIYPITIAGKIIASFFAVLGVGLIALPSGIFASELIFGEKNNKCPVCTSNLDKRKK